MTKQELEDAIHETFKQEALFRLADDPNTCAYWVLERLKLRAQLHAKLLEEIR